MYPSVTGSQRDTTATVTGREKARKRMQRFVAELRSPPCGNCRGHLQNGSYFARFGICTCKPKGSSITLLFASVRKKRICSDTSSNSSLPVQVSIGQFNPRYKSHRKLRNWNPRRCASPDERRTAGSPSSQPTS